MALEVKLDAFEGPLDLLLHLIEKNKVDIYDIPIAEITRQYMEYIKAMETEDMNVMSEFLVMAATLLDIKCKMLLPAEVNEEGEEEDPRAELVEKLIEYKMCKYMSMELKDMRFDADKHMYKNPTIPKEVLEYKAPVDYDELLSDANLEALSRIFEEVLKRAEDKIDPIRSKFGEIKKENVDLEKKQEVVFGYLRSHKHCSFRNLLSEQRSKMDTIVTFLILLELIKISAVVVKQESENDDIDIECVNIDDNLGMLLES